MVKTLHIGVAVRLESGDGDMASSVLYNPSGRVLTKRASARFPTAGHEVGIELWSLFDWEEEESGQVAVTLSAAREFAIGIVTLDDAQMPSMFRAIADYDRSAGLVFPGYPPGTMALDVIGLAGSPSGLAVTGPAQTKLVEVSTGATAADVRLGMSTIDISGNELESGWSWTGRHGVALLAVDARPIATCLAQSYLLAEDFPCAGVELGLVRTGAERTFARASMYAGDDDSPIGSPLATAFREFNDSGSAVFRFPGPLTVPAGRIWIACFVSAPVGLPGATWRTQSGNPIADGKLIVGEASLHGLDALDVDRAAERISEEPQVKWGAEIAGEDAVFRLIEANVRTFCLYDSGGVLIGCGSMDEDFNEGGISIPACAWSGEAAAGDSFTVDRDVGDNQVIFSESPAATPVKTLGTVYWNEVPAADIDIWQTSSGATVALVGYDDVIGVRCGQTVTVECGALAKRIWVRMSKVGNPVNPVILKLMRVVGEFPTDEVVATAHLNPVNFSSSVAYVPFTLGVGDRVLPAALEAGQWGFTLETSGETTTDYYIVHGAVSDVYAGGKLLKWNKDNQQWQFYAFDAGFRIEMVDLTRHLSIVDGSAANRNVARVDFNADIPDGVLITADAEGIQDTSAGLYTGTPSALIVRPDAAIHWFASVVGEVPDSRIDLARTFARAAQLYDSLYRFDGVVQDDETLKQLWLRFGFESRSDVDWPIDKLELRFLPSVATIADRMFVRTDIVSVQKTLRFDLTRTDASKIATVVRARWDRRPYEPRSLTSYDRITKAEVTAAVTDFGERERPELFLFDFIRRADMIAEVAAFWVARTARPKLRTVSLHRLAHIALEKHDDVAFDLRT